jgi:hypothetical protein
VRKTLIVRHPSLASPAFLRFGILACRRWGGGPRYVFEKLDPSDQNRLAREVQAMSMGPLKRSVRAQRVETQSRHSVLHLRADPDDPTVYWLQFGSHYMRDAVTRQAMEEERHELVEFVKTLRLPSERH